MGAGVLATAKPRHLNRLQGPLAGAAGKHDALAFVARQLRRVETRQRQRGCARNMAPRKFMGLAHVDQRDGSILQAFFQFIARDHFNHYLDLIL